MLVSLLVANAAVLPVVGHFTGGDVHDLFITPVVLTSFAFAASREVLGFRTRSVLASLGLLSAAGLLVHLTDGLTEAHFYFFVMVIAMTLYESWLPFLAAFGFVLLHHGVLGTVSPEDVFNHSRAYEQPWLWAGIHALFITLAGCVGIGAWRLNERVREQMRRTQDKLTEISETDILTGLGNRRRAMADLERLVEAGSGGGVVVLYDLDGFKAYNDAFGHPAGDAMLARLGARLGRNIGNRGCAYRLGGDEFLLISQDRSVDRRELEEVGTMALKDQGRSFVVGASCGSAVVPAEAATVSDAMRLADQRMYSRKTGARTSAMNQSKDVLLRALAERYPDLEEHNTDVAGLVRPLAITLGLTEHEMEAVCHAAELHDIGKVAIPEAILQKPGPLDEEEWQFMHRHTLIGERIVGAAPALAGIGKLIRSSHERWDGTGYPDGLEGEDIPLGARIISVCDAYDAMRARRPYRPSIPVEDALAEIERCAGTQFDPRVAGAFVALVTDREIAHERAERAHAVHVG